MGALLLGKDLFMSESIRNAPFLHLNYQDTRSFTSQKAKRISANNSLGCVISGLLPLHDVLLPGKVLCSGVMHRSLSRKGTILMKKHIEHIAQRARQALSTRVRLLALIWQTHPWYITLLLLITLALGLLPAL